MVNDDEKKLRSNEATANQTVERPDHWPYGSVRGSRFNEATTLGEHAKAVVDAWRAHDIAAKTTAARDDLARLGSHFPIGYQEPRPSEATPVARTRCMGCGHFDNEIAAMPADMQCPAYETQGHYMLDVDARGMAIPPSPKVINLGDAFAAEERRYLAQKQKTGIACRTWEPSWRDEHMQYSYDRGVFEGAAILDGLVGMGLAIHGRERAIPLSEEASVTAWAEVKRMAEENRAAKALAEAAVDWWNDHNGGVCHFCSPTTDGKLHDEGCPVGAYLLAKGES